MVKEQVVKETSTRRRVKKPLRLVTQRRVQKLANESETLPCRDRALGHDWDVLGWEDGPERSTTVAKTGVAYVCYRNSRCTRCSTQRREVFDQINNELTKRRNKYSYNKSYRIGKVNQSEIHTVLWVLSKTKS